jgi:autotransporter-associated beta strand protein
MQPSAIISHHQPSSATSGLLAVLILTVSGNLFAAEIAKDNNTTNLNNAASWVGGTAPGAADIAVFGGAISAGNGTYWLGGDITSWGQIKITNPNDTIRFRNNTLTLNGVNISGTNIGIDMSGATQDLIIQNIIKLNNDQTWVLGNGTTLAFLFYSGTSTNNNNRIDINGKALTLAGDGSFTYGARNGGSALTLTANSTFTGTLTVLGAPVRLNGANGKLSGVSEIVLAKSGLEYGQDNTSVNDRINTSARLTMGHVGDGGGVLRMYAGNQTFASLDIANGYNRFQDVSGTRAITITDGYTVSGHGMIEFDSGAGVIFTNAPSAVNGDSVIGSGASAFLRNAILATTDFVAAASGTLRAADYNNDAFAADRITNIVTNNFTTTQDETALALRLATNFNLKDNTTLTVKSGQIMASTNVTLGGNSGTLTSGGDTLTFLGENSRNIYVNSVIADGTGGALALEKFGGGELTLRNANTFSGDIYLQGGYLTVENTLALGTGTKIWGVGGDTQIRVKVDGFNLSRDIYLDKTEGRFRMDVQTGASTLGSNFTTSGNNYSFLAKTGAGTLKVTSNMLNNQFSAVEVDGGAAGELILTGTWNATQLADGLAIRGRTDGGVGAITLDENAAIIFSAGNIYRDNQSGKLTVNLKGNSRIERLTGDMAIGNNTTGALGTGTVELNLSGNSSLVSAAKIRVGNADAGVTAINISGSAYLQATEFNLNYDNKSNNFTTLAISESGSMRISGAFNTGNNATGINNSSTITLGGSAVLATADFILNESGNTGKVTLSVGDNATLAVSTLGVNRNAGAANAVASLAFSGNSTGTAANWLTINTGQNDANLVKSATTTLTVSDNATLSVNGLELNNRGTNSYATAAISGGTVTVRANQVYLNTKSAASTASLTVSGSGMLNASAADTYLNTDNETFPGATAASLTVTDSGTYLTKALTMNNSATTTTGLLATATLGGNGALIGSGAFVLNNNLTAGSSTAALNITGSAYLKSTNFTLNNNSNYSTASLSLAGSASQSFEGQSLFLNIGGTGGYATVTYAGNSSGTGANVFINNNAISGTAILNLADNAALSVSNFHTIYGNAAANSLTTLNISGGALSASSGFNVNNGNGSGNATLINLSGNGVIKNGSDMNLVTGGAVSSTLTLNIADSSTFSAGGRMFINHSGTNSLININQTGGFVEGNAIYLNASNDANSTVNYTLAGGIISARQNNQGIYVSTSATLLLTGGTIQSSSIGGFNLTNNGTNSSGVYQAGTVLVGAGGAHFNAVTGGNINANLALQHDTAAPAKDGGLTKLGAATLTLNALNTYTGDTVIKQGAIIVGANGTLPDGTLLKFTDDGGVFQNNYGNITVSGLLTEGAAAANITRVSTLTLNGSGTYSYSGSITNNNTTLVKSGAGAQELSGVSTHSGATTISGGVLLISGSGSINSTSAITVSNDALFHYTADTALTRNVTVSDNAEFKYNSAAAHTGALTFTSGTLSGNGILTSARTIGANRTIAPGNSAGNLTTGAQTWEDGGAYLWELADLTGGAGVGWDLLTINGALTLGSLTAGGFTLNIDSYGAYTAVGGNYSLLIADAASISGFDASLFTISDSIGLDQLELVQSGNGLYLNFTVIPEPSTYALLGLGALTITLLRKLRRR